MKSMTGFARREVETPYLKGSLTVKSYNNRYLEISVFLPPYLAALESRFRDAVSASVIHGKVEVSLRVREVSEAPRVLVDSAAISEVASALRAAAEAAGIQDPIRISDILSFDGVVSFERNIDADAAWTALEGPVSECLAEFNRDREREGRSTREDIEGKLGIIEDSVRIVESEAPAIEAVIRGNLAARFREVLGNAVDENRVLQEVASYLARHTINEEIVRLRSHLAAFRTAMDDPGCGKKLDFLCQEMNREANTIGSKNILARIGEAVVSLKDAIENVREQVRNVE